MTDTTLLPCPFCGATPHKGLMKVEHCQLHGEPYQRYQIMCPHGCAKKTAMTKEQAYDAWNRRDQWRTDWENAPKSDEPLYVYGRLADEPDETPFKTLVKWDDESEEWIEIGGLIFEPTHFITPPAPVSGGK